MELILTIANTIILIYGLYFAYKTQKQINEHREFLKSLESGLFNIKGSLTMKGSDLKFPPLRSPSTMA